MKTTVLKPSVSRADDGRLALAALLLAGCLAAAPAWAGTVCGHVYDAVTGAPIPGAVVRALHTDGTPTGLGASADADGAWCIDGLPGGVYHLEALANGYRIGFVRDVPVQDAPSDVDIGAYRPLAMLDDPWPNPAGGQVSFRVHLNATGSALLGVYDLAGRRVRAWGDAGADAGERTIDWNFRDDAGREVPAGRYLVRLEAGGTTITRTVVRVR